MSKQLKVGVFVLVGLILTMAAVFLIGDERQFWERKVSFVTSFTDVAGLRPGGSVRMGGVDIGSVTAVGYSAGTNDTRIHVRLQVVKKEAPRIRVGAVAHIVNKGLLGDKMLELSVPNPNAPQLPEGGELKGSDP